MPLAKISSSAAATSRKMSKSVRASPGGEALPVSWAPTYTTTAGVTTITGIVESGWLRPLSRKEGVFIYFVLDKTKGNLAIARRRSRTCSVPICRAGVPHRPAPSQSSRTIYWRLRRRPLM